MPTTYTPNKNIIQPENGSYIDTWDQPVNNNWEIIDNAFGGSFSVSVAAGNATLTQDNCQNVNIIVTGTLTSVVPPRRTVFFPDNVAGFFVVTNQTVNGGGGPYEIRLQTVSGSTYVVAVNNANTLVFSDGNEVALADNSNLVVAPGGGITLSGNTISLTAPVSVANGGTGQTTYTNGQLLIGNSTGNTLAKSTLTAGSGIVITNGPGSITISGASFDPNAANTFTGLQTFNGTINNLASTFKNIGETVTVSATAATGTINYDVTTHSVLYYTTNASGNWTLNFRASSTTTLNSIMAVGQSITVAFLVPQGAAAYYNTAITVDGDTGTPVWQNGPPTSGNANALDVYTYTIIKTADQTYTVLATRTGFFA